MELKEVIWLVIFPVACWIIYRWAVTILIWGLLGFLILFHTHPQEMNRIWQDFIIPSVETVMDYIRTRVLPELL